jgi:hypothetical protein
MGTKTKSSSRYIMGVPVHHQDRLFGGFLLLASVSAEP